MANSVLHTPGGWVGRKISLTLPFEHRDSGRVIDSHSIKCYMKPHVSWKSHDDKTSSFSKAAKQKFFIKQNNHKFTQLRNKDLSSSLDVHLISSLSFLAKTLVNTKVSATFICDQVEYMI